MKKALVFTIAMFAIVRVFPQAATSDLITTSGSSIVAEDLVISWTIGDNIVDFYQDCSGVTALPEGPAELILGDDITIHVYPTLTKDLIHISVTSENHPALQAELIDMKGSVLKMIRFDADEVEMDLSDLYYGMYIVRISDIDVKYRQNIKIIKL